MRLVRRMCADAGGDDAYVGAPIHPVVPQQRCKQVASFSAIFHISSFHSWPKWPSSPPVSFIFQDLFDSSQQSLESLISNLESKSIAESINRAQIVIPLYLIGLTRLICR